MSNLSESEDNPEILDTSDEEWEATDESKKPTRRNLRTRRAKKPKIENSDDSSSSNSDEGDTNNISNTNRSSPDRSGGESQESNTSFKVHTSNDGFTTGEFVVNKKDINNEGKNKPKCIWRVDGKSLLQKFLPFEENDETLYKSTYTYTGWCSSDKEDYITIKTSKIVKTDVQIIVQFDFDQLTEIKKESE